MKTSLTGVASTALTIALFVACGDDDGDSQGGGNKKDAASAGGTVGAPASSDAANTDASKIGDASVDRPLDTREVPDGPDVTDAQDATSDVLDASTTDAEPISDASNDSDA